MHAVLGSMAALIGSFVCCLVYGHTLLRYYHQHDTRIPAGLWAYFNSNIESEYYLSSINYPLCVGLALTGAAMAWLVFMVFYFRWPRSYLITIAAYMIIGYIFIMAMVSLDWGNFI